MAGLEIKIGGAESQLHFFVWTSAEQNHALRERRGERNSVVHDVEQRRLAEAAPQPKAGQRARRLLDGSEHRQRILVDIEPAGPEQTRLAEHVRGASGGLTIARREVAGAPEHLEDGKVGAQDLRVLPGCRLFARGERDAGERAIRPSPCARAPSRSAGPFRDPAPAAEHQERRATAIARRAGR